MPFTPQTPNPRPVGPRGTPGRYDWTVGTDAAVRELRDAGLVTSGEAVLWVESEAEADALPPGTVAVVLGPPA